MRVFVVSQAILERYNKFTRNCSFCCEAVQTANTTTKSELSKVHEFFETGKNRSSFPLYELLQKFGA